MTITVREELKMDDWTNYETRCGIPMQGPAPEQRQVKAFNWAGVRMALVLSLILWALIFFFGTRIGHAEEPALGPKHVTYLMICRAYYSPADAQAALGALPRNIRLQAFEYAMVPFDAAPGTTAQMVFLMYPAYPKGELLNSPECGPQPNL